MRYAFRLLALASATVFCIFFLSQIINLLFAYNYTHHRFAPPLIKPHEFIYTLLLGIGFLSSWFAYRVLRTTRLR